MEILKELSLRNYPLYLFGWLCILGVIYSLYMMTSSEVHINGINAWLKPTKFYISSVLFTWTMCWFLGYLKQDVIITTYTWIIILVMAFELLYITIKAANGELSHFNVTTSFNGLMFSLMGIAISIMTLATMYIGYLFFTQLLADLPFAYLWGIRLGILLFVIFAFEGGLMGSRLSHTVGAADGMPGLKFLNWSVTHGDLRIAHFVGMHALQVLPLLGYYLLTSSRAIIITSILYFLIALAILIQALMGTPLVNKKNATSKVDLSIK